MSQEIEHNNVNSAPITPLEAPFERSFDYQEFRLLNETQSLALLFVSRNHKIYWGGIALSGILLGFSVGFFDLNSSSFHFMAGASLCSHVLTFTVLRARYMREVKYLLMVCQMRYSQKLMRPQDKPLLVNFAKKMKMHEKGIELIQNAEYVPFTQAEMEAPVDLNKPQPQGYKDFNKKQFNHLFFSMITDQDALERYMVIGMGLIFIVVFWGDDILNMFMQVMLWLLFILFTAYSLSNIKVSRDKALDICAHGKVEQALEQINAPKPYTFLKTGDHLFHLVLSLICLPLPFISTLEIDFSKKVIASVAAFIILICTVSAVVKAVSKSSRFKALNKTSQSKK